MKTNIKKDSISVAKIFNEIAEKYDRINHLLSFGLDRGWRNKVIPFLPAKKGAKILDIACGSCAQIAAIAKKRPDCRFTGVDIAENLLEIGRKKLSGTNVQLDALLTSSALNLPFADRSFPAITISFGIRNMEDFEKALAEAYRVLEKDGKLFILEFSKPEGFLQKKLSLFYLKNILPKIGNLLSNHCYAYTYLNETILEFPHGKAFIDHMKKSGFTNTTFHPMTFGMVTLYIGEKNC